MIFDMFYASHCGVQCRLGIVLVDIFMFYLAEFGMWLLSAVALLDSLVVVLCCYWLVPPMHYCCRCWRVSVGPLVRIRLRLIVVFTLVFFVGGCVGL